MFNAAAESQLPLCAAETLTALRCRTPHHNAHLDDSVRSAFLAVKHFSVSAGQAPEVHCHDALEQVGLEWDQRPIDIDLCRGVCTALHHL